jgi:hypothetical protein
MARGGYRPGAGRKPNPDKPKKVATPRVPQRPPLKPIETAADTVPAEPKRDEGLNALALAELAPQIEAMARRFARERGAPRSEANNPFRVPVFPKMAVPPKVPGRQLLAMDEMPVFSDAASQWVNAGGFASEGLVFLGYSYLSELAQRPEYRTMAETIADDATRRWIDFDVVGDEKQQAEERAKDPEGYDERIADPDERRKRVVQAGKSDKVKRLKDDGERLELQSRFHWASVYDSFMGRSHLYLQIGDADWESAQGEMAASIGDGRDNMSRGKVTPETPLKYIKTVEPMWTYPLAYNAQNPLAPDWYNPQQWYVMGREINISRLQTFIARPVPDMLKPAYAFGGLPLSQMAKPYVDIWLNTRQSVADLIRAFSTMVLMTDLSTQTQPGNAVALMARMALFNMARDNMGLFVANKNTEDLKNVSAPLSGLHELQAQAQEHMLSVSRIPAVKFTGIQPAGLNASSEGEIKVYDDTIEAYQKRVLNPNLTRIINFQMLSLFGEVDPEITHRWEQLRQLTDSEKAEQAKKEADRDMVYVEMGAISPAEVRKKIIDDEDSPYAGLDPDDVPEPPQQPGMEGGEPGEGEIDMPGGAGGEQDDDTGGGDGPGGAQDLDPFGATDEFKEQDHPRDEGGKFTSGGGGGGSSAPKQKLQMPQFGLSPRDRNIAKALNGEKSETTSSKPAAGQTSEPAAQSETSAATSSELDPAKLTKQGGKLGSNEGGVFVDDQGNKFYIKRPASKAHVANELAAARLYQLAGVNTLDYRPVKGGNHVATKWENLDKNRISQMSDAERQAAAQDFAVHAWLSNWDAAGTGGDNQGIRGGQPVTLDVGGSLRYRAQGGEKGNAFGPKVSELDTMRDKSKSPDAARLFGKMTDEEIADSVARVAAIPDEKIRQAAQDDDLADILIARKRDMAKRYGVQATDEAMLQAADEANWEESKHPRAPDGKFTSGGGSGGGGSGEGLLDEALAGLSTDPDEQIKKFSAEDYGIPDDLLPPDAMVYEVPAQQKEQFIALADKAGVKVKSIGELNEEGSHEGFYVAGMLPPKSQQPPKTKKEIIGALLTKPGGTTVAEILKETGWPSVSVPQQAAALGMKLEKQVKNGKTTYIGVPMTDAEKAELKKAALAAKAKKQDPPVAAPTPAAVKAPVPAPSPAPKPAIQYPPPTPAELEKAKKSVALQMGYVPGPKPEIAGGEPMKMAEAAVKAFNDQWAGKQNLSPDQLAQKVNAFKSLQTAMKQLKNVETANQAQIAAKAKAEQAAKAKAMAEKAAAEAKAHAEKNKVLMDELGIGPDQAEGLSALAKMLGQSNADLALAFKSYEAKAKSYGYPLTGIECATVMSYSNGSYGAVNAALRSGAWTPAQHVYVSMVNKALDKMPKYTGSEAEGTHLIRNTHLTPEQIAEYTEGHIIQEKALMSTSTKKPNGVFSGNVRFVITAKGKRGASIKKLSHYGSEDEVVFKAKTFFKVNKVEKLTSKLSTGADTVIHLEEWEDL